MVGQGGKRSIVCAEPFNSTSIAAYRKDRNPRNKGPSQPRSRSRLRCLGYRRHLLKEFFARFSELASGSAGVREVIASWFIQTDARSSSRFTKPRGWAPKFWPKSSRTRACRQRNSTACCEDHLLEALDAAYRAPPPATAQADCGCTPDCVSSVGVKRPA